MSTRIHKTTGSKKRTKSINPAVSAAAFEALEDRRLFSVLTFDGSPGPDTIRFTQTGSMIAVNVNGVNLPAYAASSVDGIVFNGNAGDDRVLVNAMFSKPLTVNGGAGNDSVTGGRGNDTFNGGDGNDTMYASVGRDDFNGGLGTDTADYSGYSSPVNVTLDGLANDGRNLEQDNVRADVENVTGGLGNDTITGNASANRLQGGGGTDTLEGGAGDDVLDGGVGGALPVSRNTGADVLRGGTGDDVLHASDYGGNTMYGEAGADVLYGYGRNDYLDGGSGADTCYGGGGQDVIYGGGGDDYLDGQAGVDKVYGNYGPRAVFIIDRPIFTLGDEAGALEASGAPIIDRSIIDRPIDGTVIINPLPILDLEPVRPILNPVLPPIRLTPRIPLPDDRLIDPDLVYRPVITIQETDNDTVRGGADDDRLRGDGGNDQVLGDDGDDFCFGDAGDDVVRGGNGADNLYGGAGDDDLFGDAGDDVLVSIGGGQSDENTGGAGMDSVWADAEASELDHNDFWDALFEGAAGTHHRVGGFEQVTNGTATQTPSRELNGQNLIDPLTKNGTAYTDFSDRPLFGRLGPDKNDIEQGGLADCYYLAGLSAVAKTNARRIRESVVDLGDGTYAVQFFRNGAAEFFRVDGELPSNNGNTPAYQDLGHDDALWAAVMEKAFAFRRTGAGSYESIEYGGAQAFDVLGLTHSNLRASTGLATLKNISAALAGGQAVIAGTVSPVPAGIPIVGNHMYSIERVNLSVINIFGVEIDTGSTITVRNPWHTDGAGNSDGANDGYVTLTTAQFFGAFDWCRGAVA